MKTKRRKQLGIPKQHRQSPVGRDLWQQLDELLDQSYDLALQMGWNNPKLAQEAGIATSTVYRIGLRLTVYPRWETVARIARSVGLEIAIGRPKLKIKQA